MKLKICYQEGREERCTEIVLTANYMEDFRQAYKKALKYSNEPIPEGLLAEGEAL